ncbi:MAG: SDR family oxidoreductase [Bacteroidetes bacterium]|nr:SDR family oxidoreductase [Bacteroidota bacterium]
MPTKTVLISGTSGFLGWNLAQHFHAKGYDIVGTWHSRKLDHGVARLCIPFDLATDDPESLLAAASPQVVVHCAAMSSRKDCDADPALARKVNVQATARLAESCAERGTLLFFVSTDLVFDGSAAPYAEDDPVSPASVYAETKAEAEEAVRLRCPHSHVLRVALMYGTDAWKRPASFLSWNAGDPLRGKPVRLYTNQYRMPLYVNDVALAIELLLQRDIPFGTWHLAGPERLSRHEIGLRIAAHFGIDADLMQPVTLERDARYGQVDDTSLLTEKFIAATGMRFTPLNEGLANIAHICGY